MRTLVGIVLIAGGFALCGDGFIRYQKGTEYLTAYNQLASTFGGITGWLMKADPQTRAQYEGLKRQQTEYMIEMGGGGVLLLLGLGLVVVPGASSATSKVNPQTAYCPYCAEEVLPDARKCKHCGEWFAETSVDTESTPQQGKRHHKAHSH